MSDFKFSHTSMSCWRRCRYQFYLKYVEGYRMKQSFGQMTGASGHVALAYWYKQDDHIKNTQQDDKAIDVAWQSYCKSWLDLGLPVDNTYFEPAEAALRRYFPLAREEDKKWKVLATELNFDVKLGKHSLIGFIDLVVETNKQVWLVEHKFNKQVSTQHLDLDPQVSTYLLASTIAGYKPIGVIYNIIRTSGGPTAIKQPFVRTMLYRNPEGLQSKANEMNGQMDEMDSFLTNGGIIYRNETHDCHWDCTYYDVCLSITDNGSPDEVLEKMERQPTQYGDEDYES